SASTPPGPLRRPPQVALENLASRHSSNRPTLCGSDRLFGVAPSRYGPLPRGLGRSSPVAARREIKTRGRQAAYGPCAGLLPAAVRASSTTSRNPCRLSSTALATMTAPCPSESRTDQLTSRRGHRRRSITHPPKLIPNGRRHLGVPHSRLRRHVPGPLPSTR